MATFVVEVYVPPSMASELSETIRRLGDARDHPPSNAPDARYVRSTFVLEDEVCFHVFEAASAAAVRDLGSRLALTFDRVLEAREAGIGNAI